MRRGLVIAVAALVGGAASCGGGDQARMRLATPPERQGAEPLPEIRRAQQEAVRASRVRATKADAERSRPVLRAWALALRRNNDERAAAFFSLPAIVAQGAARRLESAADVRAFHVTFQCGVRLLDVTPSGRYLVGTFRLTRRVAHTCSVTGHRLRVAFVMRGRKIAEWREVPNVPGAPPGPPAREDAPPLPPKQVA
ncbi:MAG TPA: hypothetical protein VN213_13795 [Solirubrobacteraceae bacterium]|nr:hypothetical protein [Solirubrobacteraceae bacterium]